MPKIPMPKISPRKPPGRHRAVVHGTRATQNRGCACDLCRHEYSPRWRHSL